MKFSRSIFMAIVMLIFWAPLWTQVPCIMNYQGKLTDSDGAALNGTYSIKFRIYDVSAGGTPLWEETRNVPIVNGLFDEKLGTITTISITFGVPYWIELSVWNGGSYEDLAPREKLVSVGYAFRALHTDTAAYASTGGGGIPSGAIMMWSGTLASIPSGWALCDGTGGTPDLRDKFIYGCSDGVDPGGTGGATSHVHSVDIPSTGTSAASASFYVTYSGSGLTPADEGHTHYSDPPQTDCNSSNNLPPYYKLAFIMKL